MTNRCDRCDICSHNCKWLVKSSLAVAQFCNRVRIGRITRKMEAAQSFDGNDISFPQQTPCFENGGSADLYARYTRVGGGKLGMGFTQLNKWTKPDSLHNTFH